MKAPNFAYTRPSSLEEAFAILDEHGDAALPLAGGQSLITTLNMRLSYPELLVDIGDLAALRGISVEEDHIRIGATTRHVDVMRSAEIKIHAPLLAEAIQHVGHVAIRNRGTFGGSLAYADPAAEMPACAVALDATLILASNNGRREVRAPDFFKGLFETDLQRGELLVEARIPKLAPGRVSAFAELSRRSGDFAVAGLAAVGQFADGALHASRLVYLGCDDGPRLATRVAEAVVRQGLPLADKAALREAVASDCVFSSAPGLADRTKWHLASVLTGRVLETLAARAAN